MAINIGRREFMVALGGAATLPLAARAQQPGRVRRVGVLMTFAADDPDGQADFAVLAQGSARIRLDRGSQPAALLSLGCKRSRSLSHIRGRTHRAFAGRGRCYRRLGRDRIPAGQPHCADCVRDDNRSGRRRMGRKPEEGHLLVDHVHMLISIPPKHAVSQVIGFIKGKSAIHLARVYGAAAAWPRLTCPYSKPGVGTGLPKGLRGPAWSFLLCC
jgi:hypothetical protein